MSDVTHLMAERMLTLSAEMEAVSDCKLLNDSMLCLRSAWGQWFSARLFHRLGLGVASCEAGRNVSLISFNDGKSL